jgi:hypothetical protein
MIKQFSALLIAHVTCWRRCLSVTADGDSAPLTIAGAFKQLNGDRRR